MENVTVKVESAEGELILRTGEAPKLTPSPVQFTIDGTIDAPSAYFAIVGKHYPDVLDKAVALVNENDGTIVLKINPEDTRAAVVRGQVKSNPVIDGLKINGSTRWSGEEVCNYLRKYPQVLVVDKGENKMDVRALTNKFKDLKYKVTQEVNKQDDERGNVVDNFLQKVSGNDLPSELRLQGALFIGGESKEFEVTLGLEAGNKAILFYFYSAEYELAKQAERKALLDSQVEKIGKDSLCVIKVG
jgi:hypothetical protein